MCYNESYNKNRGCESEEIFKAFLSSDCSLQLENMKSESLVIANQHVAVNKYLSFAHTARHARG